MGNMSLVLVNNGRISVRVIGSGRSYWSPQHNISVNISSPNMAKTNCLQNISHPKTTGQPKNYSSLSKTKVSLSGTSVVILG